MEELTAEEIVKYAIRIEQESYKFYKKASRMLEGSDLATLACELAEQEVGHINQLKGLLKEDEVIDEELSSLLTLDTSLFERIIAIKDIHSSATPLDILKTALERETMTLHNYEMIFQLAKLNEDVKKVFEQLRERERNHVERISGRIAGLKSKG
jgi:rubrerythrin